MENLSDVSLKDKNNFKRKIIGIVSIVLIFFFIIFCFSLIYTIETGFVGVKVRFGKYSMDEVEPGIHFKIPIIESIKKVDVKVRTFNYVKRKRRGEGIIYREPISVLDKRGLRVLVELTIQYQLRPNMAAEVLSQYGNNWEFKLIHPIVRDTVRDIIAKYPAEELPLKRSNIAQEIATSIIDTVSRIKDNPLQITAVQLRNIILPERIARKIEEVQLAKQEAEKMKAYEEKAQREQRVRIIEAETMEKEKILKARGEAEANRLLSNSITQRLIEWKKLQIQEKMADAIKENPNVRLFYGTQPGNIHLWIDEGKSKR